MILLLNVNYFSKKYFNRLFFAATIAVLFFGLTPATIKAAPPGQAEIIINKTITSGPDEIFDFVLNGPTSGAPSIAVSGGFASSGIISILPGTYFLDESPIPLGWNFDGGAMCALSTNVSDIRGTPDSFGVSGIQIDPGDTVICNFSNTYNPTSPGTLRIIKNTINGAGGETFNFPVFATPIVIQATIGSLSSTSGLGLASLTPGLYEISEDPIVGWTETGTTTCDNGDPINAINITPGSVVTCTFENTYTTGAATGTLQILKNTNGGPGGNVNFTIGIQQGATVLPPFLMAVSTSSSIGSGYDSRPVGTGTYSLAESSIPDWNLASAICDNGDPVTAVTIGAGDTVTCSFNNTYTAPTGTGNLIIHKIATGGSDGTFDFNVLPTPGLISVTTTGAIATGIGNGDSGLISMATGSYTLNESLGPEWAQQNGGFYCSSSDGTTFPVSPNPVITIGDGTTVTCYMTNSWVGYVHIIKTTAGGDGTFTFGWGQGSHSITTTSNYGDDSYIVYGPGVRNIYETLSAGWSITSVVCNLANGTPTGVAQGGPGLDDVMINPGEITTCTFTNTTGTPPAAGTLQIIKNTIGGNGTFNFSMPAVFGAPANVSVTTTGGTGSSALISLPNQSSLIGNITEVSQANWAQTPLSPGVMVSCTDQFGTHILNPGFTDEGFGIYAGQTTTCTFENTYTAPPPPPPNTGTIRLIKNTYGAGGTFTFETNSRIGTTPYAPENIFPISPVTLNANSVNLYQPFIDSTNITTSKAYSIDETALPAGFTLTDAFCDTTYISTPTGVKDILVVAGGTTTCYFENTYTAPPPGMGTLEVNKIAVGGDGTFTFSGDTGMPAIATVTGSGYASVDLSPGTNYILNEAPLANWTLTSAQCTNLLDPTGPLIDLYDLSGNPLPITIEDGKTSTCTFTNTYSGSSGGQGTLMIIKNTTGGDGSFDYAVSGATSTSSTAITMSGVGSTSFTLNSGTYSLTEPATPGWTNTSSSCDNGDPLNAIIITSGTTVTCTFYNEQDSVGDPYEIQNNDDIPEPDIELRPTE